MAELFTTVLAKAATVLLEALLAHLVSRLFRAARTRRGPGPAFAG